MIGILVSGDNHFIVSGSLPDPIAARELVRHWTVIQITQHGQAGRAVPPSLRNWAMVTRAFREDLEWAVVVPGDGEITRGVARLLEELSRRGITIRCD
jgi:hypothetical protein